MDFVTTASECLTQGVSVEIVGRPGSGRSILLDSVAATLHGAGHRVVRIRGIGALRERPMGALVPTVPGLGRQSSIADAVGHLTAELAGGGFLVVDDADDLDDVTAGVIVAVRESVRAPVLIGRRTAGRPPEHVRRMVAGAVPGIRHVLRPLTFDALRALLEAHLGGPIDWRTMASLATMSGGLPGLARVIALVSRMTGALTDVDGLWTASGPLWSAELGQAIDALLVDASDEDVEALTLLAVAGSFRVDDARSLVSAKRLERLCELGLIDVVEGSGGGSVALSPPVIGEYLREQCTTATRAAVRDRLSRVGLRLPPALLTDRHPTVAVEDALVSHTLADHQTAAARERLAVWEDAPTATNAAALIEALFQTSSFVADPDDIRARTDASGCSEEARAMAETFYAVYQWLVRRDPDRCRALLDDVVRTFPAVCGIARSTRAYLQVFDEGISPQLLTDLRAGAAQDGANEVEMSAFAQVVAATGGTRQALSALDRLVPETAFVADKCRVLVGVCLLLDGRVKEALRWATDGLQDAQLDRSTGAFQGHAYVVALATTVKGGLSELERVASLAMTLTGGSELHAHYLAGVAGVTAARRRWLGLEGIAARTCDFGRTERQGIFPFAFSASGCAEDLACDTLWCQVDNAVRKGYLAAASFAAVEAAEQDPDADRLARVEAVLLTQESPFLTDLVRLARAVVDRDTGALAEIGHAFAARDAWLYVVRAGLQRAYALREAGDNRGAAVEVAALWKGVVPQTNGLDGMFATYVQRLELSPRELEIARFAVSGRSAVDIANALVLSVRTVEHHLLNTYRKVGVDSREGLRAAFHTWLRSAHGPTPAPAELTVSAGRR
ncbi:transcriptional regulator, LuxR family [Xylanimonas cellulosilytica DSM 15894]|uniref:Transcriptional regulator, LuxR family n=1 Tax=Xylanimonas cellulosilytica (strain DSM 15894 / JCM 12276 / CECT 5975 / KCTC 9989 / LMG 20990 / NBRC 107835 / XIL07) TaxID=446471 RepID=D1BT01_XYLCX|nr:helix-turn-helix transcriptional regulator [Xylanimonas cellulosilytica]ACZ30843.1 transcriptional regulator, LuxR family [Xylanimonas cellulosilytica DSM 15894]